MKHLILIASVALAFGGSAAAAATDTPGRRKPRSDARRAREAPAIYPHFLSGGTKPRRRASGRHGSEREFPRSKIGGPRQLVTVEHGAAEHVDPRKVIGAGYNS